MILFRQVGSSRIAANLRRAVEKLPGEVERALFAEAKIEMKEAVQRTPIDTGDLRRSAKVVKSGRGFKGVEVNISFGDDEDVYYAVYVHEIEAEHKIGQWKYLESVLRESAPYMAARVARRMQLDDMKWL